MAAPVKKRDIQRNTDERDSDNDDRDSSSSEDNDRNVPKEQGMEIQVEFEGRYPLDPDYHGIKTLLQQLFLKAHIDLGGLTDLIIAQNYVGSVVKQSDDVEGSDDEDSDVNDVFGITTVINLSNDQHHLCIQQLKDLLKQLSSEYSTNETHTILNNLIENNSETVGLLINERIVNISAQISVPLLENLISDMRRANNKKMPFNFTYYILICKLYKTEDKKVGRKMKNKRKENEEETTILWSNPEEEIFAEEATYSFEFSVEKDSDSGLSGTWTESDEEMIPYRRVLLFEADKLQTITEKIKSHVS